MYLVLLKIKYKYLKLSTFKKSKYIQKKVSELVFDL